MRRQIDGLVEERAVATRLVEAAGEVAVQQVKQQGGCQQSGDEEARRLVVGEGGVERYRDGDEYDAGVIDP